MAARLGEILIKNGSLTQSQLDAALKSQLILGGHLGTSLIELGFVDEATLGEALSRMCRVPYAPPNLFANISEATIHAVPRKIAEEYEAIPIKATDKSVEIALANAGDLRVVDELSFSVGRRVIPWIAPEVRIYQALERYYGVARRPRYISLSVHLDENVLRDKRRIASIVKPPEPIGPIAAVADHDEREDHAFGFRKSWQEVANEIELRTAAAAPPKATTPPAMPAKPSPIEAVKRVAVMPLSALAEHYCDAESIEDLARATLDFSIGRAERMLLMKVRAGRASIWHDRGMELTDEKRRSLSFQVNSEPLFQLLAGEDYYFGSFPPKEDVRSSYRKFGVEAPVELLLIPIRVNDLLVAVALADGGRQGRVRGDVGEFLTAFRAFGMCVNLLAVRRKVRVAMGAEAPAAVAEAAQIEIPTR